MENVSSRLLRTKHSCKMHYSYKRENAAQRGKEIANTSLFCPFKKSPPGNDKKTEEWWTQWIRQEKEDLVGIIANSEEKGSKYSALTSASHPSKIENCTKNSCATSKILLPFASLASINLIFYFLCNFLPFPHMCMYVHVYAIEA